MNTSHSKNLLILLSLFAFAACQQKAPTAPATGNPDSTKTTAQAPADTTAADSASTDVDAITAATSKPNEATFHGTLVAPPQQTATISSTMGGMVKHLHLAPGQHVSAGQVVATLQNQEFITLQQTYLDCAAQTDYLGTEYLRQKTLAGAQAASEKKLQQAHADFLSMKSRRDAAATQLRLLGVSPSQVASKGLQAYLHVTSPRSGYVANLQANIGKYLNVGDAICDIINNGSLQLKLTVYEKDLSLLHLGERIAFRVSGLNDNIYFARITSIGQNIDASTRALDVFANIQHPSPKFRAGMYATARIER